MSKINHTEVRLSPGAELIDTHCHLEMDPLGADIEGVVQRALAAGIVSLITIGSDPQSNPKLLAIAERFDQVYAAVGVHPHEARFVDDAMMQSIRQWAAHKKVVAIGETGLDYHYDNSPRDKQQEAFAAHLSLAKELDLPAVIHVREAEDDAISIIRESGITRGVLHCFSGASRLLDLAIEMGLCLSIAGPVTFNKAVELKAAVKRIPDELLLLETDSPYLSPVPFRGKVNEPAYVIHTAAEVAMLRGVTIEDVARISTVNARRLFGLKALSNGADTLVYKIRNSLYLNVTNQCTNCCTFCVRYHTDYVKGHNLRLSHEPTTEEFTTAIGDPSKYDEVVFCGYGEPTIRLDLLKDVARWVKDHGGRVRLNTNGHGNAIHKRNVLPELQGLVDEISISLDAPDAQTYENVCNPDFEGAYEAVVEFLRLAPQYIPVVKATVVDAPGVDVEASRRIAESLGATFRVRSYNVVG